MLRVSSTAFEVASTTCSVSDRPPKYVSQSSAYSATWCVLPSVMLTSNEKAELLYQVAAIPPEVV